jgi:hypothetical protein
MFFFWIIQVWWSCWIWNKGYHRYNQGYFLLWPTPIDWQWASVCSERNSMTKEIISMWLYLLYEHSSSLCICMGAYWKGTVPVIIVAPVVLVTLSKNPMMNHYMKEERRRLWLRYAEYIHCSLWPSEFTPSFEWDRVVQSLLFCSVFCGPLFVSDLFFF